MGACEDDDSDDEAMPYLIPVYPKQVEFTVQVSGDVVQANVAGARPPQSSTEPSLEEAAAGALWRDTTAADAPREPMKICWKAKGAGDAELESWQSNQDWQGRLSDPRALCAPGAMPQQVPDGTDPYEEEFGYPKWPEEMKDPDYWREEFRRMQTDPRHNPNLGRSMQHPDFWNEAVRRPWAKVLLRREQFWTDRKSAWLGQLETISRSNRAREVAIECLENCPADVKRLVMPVLRYKIVESMVLGLLEEAQETGVPFEDLIQREETIRELRAARHRLDDGGAEEAARMLHDLDALSARAGQMLEAQRKEEERERGRVLIDMQGLKIALDFGQKAKRDGLLEWQQGRAEEALASWRQGDDALRRFRPPRRCTREAEMLASLQGALLRNLSQAALRLERWGEALEAAERALELDPEDHKAWFRRACALEGLSDFGGARECLRCVEELAVGRGDRPRLERDCRRKRERFRALEAHSRAEHGRMLRRGCRLGVFGSGRAELQAGATAAPPVAAVAEGGRGAPRSRRSLAAVAVSPAALPAASVPPAAPPVPSPALPSAQPSLPAGPPAAAGHKRITRDGVSDLLDDLKAAYADPGLRRQIDKLIRDVRFDAGSFMQHIGAVVLPVQEPVLRKWGFDASRHGVAEMRAAIQDHTRGARADLELKGRADEVNSALFGSPELCMRERVMGTGPAPA